MKLSDFDYSVIYTRTDGSYLLDKGMYHVPNNDEFKELWTEIDDYVKRNNIITFSEKVNSVDTYKLSLQGKITEYNDWLIAHDYIGTKIATGRATVEDYKDEIEKMKQYAVLLENAKTEYVSKYGEIDFL